MNAVEYNFNLKFSRRINFETSHKLSYNEKTCQHFFKETFNTSNIFKNKYFFLQFSITVFAINC